MTNSDQPQSLETLLAKLKELDYTNRHSVLVWLEAFFESWAQELPDIRVRGRVAAKIGRGCDLTPKPDLPDVPEVITAGSEEYAEWLIIKAINTLLISEDDRARRESELFLACFDMWWA